MNHTRIEVGGIYGLPIAMAIKKREWQRHGGAKPYKRADMNGISRNNSRWKANSGDAAEITPVGDASGVGMISEQRQ